MDLIQKCMMSFDLEDFVIKLRTFQFSYDYLMYDKLKIVMQKEPFITSMMALVFLLLTGRTHRLAIPLGGSNLLVVIVKSIIFMASPNSCAHHYITTVYII